MASPLVSYAQDINRDIIGGTGFDSAQTMHHCGYLPAHASSYTTTPLTIRIVQQKLRQLNYNPGPADGRFGPASQAATRAFQRDYQLPATGQVDGKTASLLAYASHPAQNVGRCFAPASPFFRMPLTNR